eukprot:3934175-Rhodomonas_salina.3
MPREAPRSIILISWSMLENAKVPESREAVERGKRDRELAVEGLEVFVASEDQPADQTRAEL